MESGAAECEGKSVSVIYRTPSCSYVFFFSSRRRHTRFDCDWSSDVCSSDLLPLVKKDDREHVEHGCFAIGPDFPEHSVGWYRRTFDIPKSDLGKRISVEFDEIGRASCRERV